MHVYCIILCFRELIFTFVLNKVFAAARKLNTKRNKTGFILYACDSPPLDSRIMFYVLGYVLLRQSKTLNKIYEKILCSVGFRKLALKFCAPNQQTPTPTFVN